MQSHLVYERSLCVWTRILMLSLDGVGKEEQQLQWLLRRNARLRLALLEPCYLAQLFSFSSSCRHHHFCHTRNPIE